MVNQMLGENNKLKEDKIMLEAPLPPYYPPTPQEHDGGPDTPTPCPLICQMSCQRLRLR